MTPFEQFWTFWPRKTAKKAAEKAFARLNPDAETLAKILAAIEDTDWPADQTYIPHASTWLNGERWNDDTVQTPRSRQVHTEIRNRHVVTEWARYQQGIADANRRHREGS